MNNNEYLKMNLIKSETEALQLRVSNICDGKVLSRFPQISTLKSNWCPPPGFFSSVHFVKFRGTF